jgi:hypothetical protein
MAGSGFGSGSVSQKYIAGSVLVTNGSGCGSVRPKNGTPTKRQVSKRQVSKCLVSKTSETSGLQNVRFTKRQVYKMSGLQNVRSSKRPVAKNIHLYSVLVVGGNPQVLLQPCLKAK